MPITQEQSYKITQRGIGLDVTNGCIACDLPTSISRRFKLNTKNQ